MERHIHWVGREYGIPFLGALEPIPQVSVGGPCPLLIGLRYIVRYARPGKSRKIIGCRDCAGGCLAVSDVLVPLECGNARRSK